MPLFLYLLPVKKCKISPKKHGGKISVRTLEIGINHHLFVSKNEVGRDFVAGDVHGHYMQLMDELRKVDFVKGRDRLFLLGDLPNRGPDSVKCIQLLADNFGVRGNHCQMICDYHEDESLARVLASEKVGGQWAIDLKQDNPVLFEQLSALIYAKSYYAITLETSRGTLGLMHAQAPDDWQLIQDNMASDDIYLDGLWQHQKYTAFIEDLEPVKNIDVVVHGHTNSSEVVVKHNMIWMDTLRNGKGLTLLSVEQLFDLIEGQHD